MWAVFVFRGLNSPPCLGRDLQELPDRWNYIQQRHQWPKLIKTQIRLQDELGGSVVGEDQGRGKHRRDRKNRERGRDGEIDISTRPLQVSVQTPTCVPPERASEGGGTLTTAHGVSKPGNQPGVRHLWDSHVCVHKCVVEICCLGPFPRGLLLAAGKQRWGYWGWLDFELWAEVCMSITHEINLPSGEPLARGSRSHKLGEAML